MKNRHFRYFLFVVSIIRFGSLTFGQLCETSAPLGVCGPYYYPPVTGSNGSNVNVLNDFWNSAKAPAGSSQTIYSISPGNWYVEATFSEGNTAVESYPDSDAIYTNAPPLVSNFTYMYSSFAEKMNLNSNTAAEAAYDIWLNGHDNEVMIWTDISNRSTAECRSLGNAVSFGGSNGVPKHLWDLWKCGGSEIIWELNQPALRLSGTSSGRKNDPVFQQENVEVGTPTVYGITRGSVDIHAMLTWLMTNGYLPPDSTDSA